MDRRVLKDMVLDFVRDDYEAPHTIAGDITREMGRPINEAQVRDALLELAATGYVQAYVFDKLSSQFELINVADATQESPVWFKATDVHN